MSKEMDLMIGGINTTLGLRSRTMVWMNSPRVGVRWSIIELMTPPRNASSFFSLVLSNWGVDCYRFGANWCRDFCHGKEKVVKMEPS